MKHTYACLALGALAVLLYINTLSHGFVLDDEVVITRNTFVQQGISGMDDLLSNDSFSGYDRVGAGKSVLEGGRYRPLSLIVFAILFQFGGADPMPFHALSILCYAGLVVMLYTWLQLLLRDLPGGRMIALLAVSLFTVHPIHTEVVSNIKGMDETLALLFGAFAMYSLLRAYDMRSKKWEAISVLAMFLAGMAKEGAVALAVTGPLSLWFFRNANPGQCIRYAIPMVTGVVGYVVLRTIILGQMQPLDMAVDPLNNAFLNWSGDRWIPYTGIERMGTIAYVCWKYLQLLFFPYPLTHDYYPFVIEGHDLTSALDWTGLLAMVGLLVGGLWGLWKRVPFGYSLLFYVITLLVSLNLFFPIGTFMAERFLFTPSLGFCLGAVMLAMLWKRQYSSKINWMLAPAMVIIGLFAIMTITRNRVWKNNVSLYEADLDTSAKSVKLNHDYGSIKLTQALSTTDSTRRKGLVDTAYTHMMAATTRHPSYYDAFVGLGASAYYKRDYATSVFAYQRAIALFPQDSNSMMGLHHALQGLATDLTNAQRYDKAIEALQVARQIYPDTAIANRILVIKKKMDEQ